MYLVEWFGIVEHELEICSKLLHIIIIFWLQFILYFCHINGLRYHVIIIRLIPEKAQESTNITVLLTHYLLSFTPTHLSHCQISTWNAVIHVMVGIHINCKGHLSQFFMLQYLLFGTLRKTSQSCLPWSSLWSLTALNNSWHTAIWEGKRLIISDHQYLLKCLQMKTWKGGRREDPT